MIHSSLAVLALAACLSPSSITMMVSAAPAGKPSFLFLLGDDIGWSDFSYNNGTAITPNIDDFATRAGSIKLMDFHSAGTVCAPTRATVLTGRHHSRDCVDGVYGCSDPTECTPRFDFAPANTFTIGDAARAASDEYYSEFSGKWHLGSFWNDSEAYGGITSNPVTHGFDHFNATIEVAPTATTNCNCNKEWESSCMYGHYNGTDHCNGHKGPGGNNCCFNYWSNDDQKEHGITNLTFPVGPDDTEYLTNVFSAFLAERKGAPFLAQISFHNCHIPYIGTTQARADCAAGKTCKPAPAGGYSDAQLDFYACLVELDAAVGRVFSMLKSHGYYDNTFTMFTTDNGPEGDCDPEGRCTADHFRDWPGSAGPLRGRKRDIWEGGHRVPGIVSWPAVVQGSWESWETVSTTDYLATMMDVLDVDRPKEQQDWAFDGVSLMPLLTNSSSLGTRGMGWYYQGKYGYRYGDWKIVHGSKSCTDPSCKVPKLYDLSTDFAETTDLATQNPTMYATMQAKLAAWVESINESRKTQGGQSDGLCKYLPVPTPVPTPAPSQ